MSRKKSRKTWNDGKKRRDKIKLTSHQDQFTLPLQALLTIMTIWKWKNKNSWKEILASFYFLMSLSFKRSLRVSMDQFLFSRYFHISSQFVKTKKVPSFSKRGSFCLRAAPNKGLTMDKACRIKISKRKERNIITQFI